MKGVATVVMNRVNIPFGEYQRVGQGNLRNIMFQEGQFDCFSQTLGGEYNPQNVYNMRPEQIHYDIADWALGGGILNAAGESLWYFNPYSPSCPPYFPRNRTGVIQNRIVNHCFYIPTQKYAQT